MRSVALRVWAAVAYALLPAVLGAVAAGRLGTAVVAVLLPLAGAGRRPRLRRRAAAGSGRAGWAAGLVLARDGGVRPAGSGGRLPLAAVGALG